MRVIVASYKTDVLKAAKDLELVVVPLSKEVETRQAQLSQALLEAIADDQLKSGDRVVALYASFDRVELDTLSIVDLGDHLERLSARDLQKLKTPVPLETLRSVVDLAVEIGREGREGKPVGTLFVVGDHRKVIQMSHEGVHDPFRGYNRNERELDDNRVRESIKEIRPLDGAFVIASRGLSSPQVEFSMLRPTDCPSPRGWARGTGLPPPSPRRPKRLRLQSPNPRGLCVCSRTAPSSSRIEPMDRAMKWQDFEHEPPGGD